MRGASALEVEEESRQDGMMIMMNVMCVDDDNCWRFFSFVGLVRSERILLDKKTNNLRFLIRNTELL